MTQLAADPVDTARSEAFAERMLTTLNHGATAMMVSIGHRTGLFDAMSTMPPATSHAIADFTDLNERYVREWLNAMVVSEVIEYNPADQTYSLPAEHAAWLTRSATPNNIAVTMQMVPMLALVEERIIDCFKRGGGVKYEEFHRFHEVMAEDSYQTVVSQVIEQILPLVPGLREKLERGIDVLDVGCGRGRAILRLAEHFPRSTFTGYDLSEEATAWANEQAAALGLTNARFQARDVTRIDEPERYDLITAFDAIHDQMHPDKVLREIHLALKKGGTFLMQDIRASSHVEKNIDHPVGPFLYTVSTMHCMTVSLANCGCGLGTVWGEELAVQMIREAGFEDVEIRQLEHDFMNNFYIMTR